MSLTMSLLSTKDIGGSMLELSITEEVEDESPRIKESKGLLRRAFSSKRRKKKKEFVTNISPRGSSLKVSPISPTPPCSCLLAAPFPGGYTQGELSPGGYGNFLGFPGSSSTPGSPGGYSPTLGRYSNCTFYTWFDILLH